MANPGHVAPLTSQVMTLWSAREACQEALAQALIGVGLFIRYDYLFGSGDVILERGGGIGLGAPGLGASDVREFLGEWINLGYPAFQKRLNLVSKVLLLGQPLESRYPDFLDVIQGPMDILNAQLHARALPQTSPRYWVSGRRRVRTTKEES